MATKKGKNYVNAKAFEDLMGEGPFDSEDDINEAEQSVDDYDKHEKQLEKEHAEESGESYDSDEDDGYYIEHDDDDIETQIDTLIKKDQIDNKSDTLERRGRFGRTECVVTDCIERQKLSLAIDKAKVMQKELQDMRRQKEILESKLSKKLSTEQLESIERDIKADEEVKYLNNFILKQKVEIDNLKQNTRKLKSEFDTYKEETSLVKTKFEADREMQQLLKNIKTLEDQRNMLLIKNDELQKKNDKVLLMYNKLVDVYNAKLEDLNMIINDIKRAKQYLKDIKMVQKKGMTFKPIKKTPEPTATTEKRPLFAKIFRWPAKN